jgi:hypothetical protein
MKPIQILIVLLSLAYAGVKLNAQTPGDTVKIMYKGKTHKVNPQREPDEEESSTTWKFRDTVKKEMVLIKVTVKDDDEDGKWWDKRNVEGRDTSYDWKKKILNLKDHNKKERKFISTYFLPTFDIGMVSSMHDAGKTDSLSPRLGKSVNLNINYLKWAMNLYKSRTFLSFGISGNMYFLKNANKQQVQYIDGAGHMRTYNDSVNRFKTNRLDISYLSVPVLLEYHSRNEKFNIAAGVEFGFSGQSKFVQKGSREIGDFKQSNRYDVKVNPSQINAIVKVGMENIAIFGRYSITDTYQASAYTDATNPHQHLLSVGICIFGI